jgi:hypothetical protein
MLENAAPQRAAVRPPEPRYEGLFQEPEYPDGPYVLADEDDALESID